MDFRDFSKAYNDYLMHGGSSADNVIRSAISDIMVDKVKHYPVFGYKTFAGKDCSIYEYLLEYMSVDDVQNLRELLSKHSNTINPDTKKYLSHKMAIICDKYLLSNGYSTKKSKVGSKPSTKRFF